METDRANVLLLSDVVVEERPVALRVHEARAALEILPEPDGRSRRGLAPFQRGPSPRYARFAVFGLPGPASAAVVLLGIFPADLCAARTRPEQRRGDENDRAHRLASVADDA